MVFFLPLKVELLLALSGMEASVIQLLHAPYENFGNLYRASQILTLASYVVVTLLSYKQTPFFLIMHFVSISSFLVWSGSCHRMST